MGFKGDFLLVLDFGSQYTQLIARRIRELKVYCQIEPFSLELKDIQALQPKGIILSGGPASVYESDAPMVNKELLSLGVPVLGICYGLQLMAHLLGGKVAPTQKREYGPASLEIADSSSLFFGLEENECQVWMSHGDRLEAIPPGFSTLASSQNAPYAAISAGTGRLFGLQFHPEVVHTPKGKDILANFVLRICQASPSWEITSFLEQTVAEIAKTTRGRKVVLGVSGGVDSTVTAAILKRAVGEGLHCIFVDNGLLRKNEAKQVTEFYQKELGVNFTCVDARQRFLKALAKVTNPEEKRKKIGRLFIRIFEETARTIPGVEFLAQGTLYPDIIESRSVKGPSATIKSHHNVGGLPARLKLKLIEPLKELFKDEVRQLGQELGLPHASIYRQPFPGPGLAVRILGKVSDERIALLQEADALVEEEMSKAGLTEAVWQAFPVLLPVRTVGVKGDARSYEQVIALRVVESKDGMTADFARLPYDLLATIASRIMNEVPGVNRVVYDISSKPPSTIEWE
ncbi:MAG: glutamine-hydrolyzing GMP synthase [Thermodesulfobacteriota bacterium]